MDTVILTGDDYVVEERRFKVRLNGIICSLSMLAVMLGGILATGH